ncbi:MAG: hypothetical protein RH917_19780 [Lacipirellulaceae bacterium]
MSQSFQRTTSQRTISFVLGLLASVALFCCASATDAKAQESSEKPVAVVAFSGYDALMTDIDFIGNLGNVPNLSAQIDGMLGMFTQGKGLAGLDKGKPIGVVVRMDENGAPAGAICLPVTDLQALVGIGQGFGVTAEDKGNGLWEISSPGQPEPMFAQEGNGWAFLAPSEQMLEGAPADPDGVLGALTKEYDLAVKINVQEVPEAFKQQYVEFIAQMSEQGLRQNPGAEDADIEELLAEQRKAMQEGMKDMDTLTVGLSLDSGQQRTFLDFVSTAIPGSDAAKQVAGMQDVTTDYAGFIQPDAAMMMTMALKMDEKAQKQFIQSLSLNKQQALASIENEDDLDDEAKKVVKSAIDDLWAALEATVAKGKFDIGAVMNLGADDFSFVAGGFNGDPSKIESGIKKLMEVAKENEEFPEVNWNASSHNGVQFHTASKEIPADEEEARQIFGDTLTMALGLGEESAYFAVGRNAVNAIKEVMDASASAGSKTVPPMEISFAATQITEFASVIAGVEGGAEAQAMIEGVSNMLANDASGRDHIRMLLTIIPNGSKFRIEAEEGVLRAIGMLVMQAQMQQAGAF